MKRLKHILALVLVLAFSAAMLTACGSSQDSSQGSAEASAVTTGADGTVTVYFDTDEDPETMSPYGNTAGNFEYRTYCYEQLYTLNYEGEYIPNLAESMEVNEDQTEITIKLHDNITTFDGYNITAEDVLWSFEQTADSAYKRFVTPFDLENSYALDEHTVVLAVTDYNYFIVNNLSQITITSKESYEASGDDMFYAEGGTGPYKVESYTPGYEVVFVKNEDYWNKDTEREVLNQNADKIVVRVITEPAQRTVELVSGTIDIISNINSQDIDYLDSQDGISIVSTPSNMTTWLYFNGDEENNSTVAGESRRAIRQAIAYAIDNEGINSSVWAGLYHTPTSVVPPNAREYDKSWDTDGRDYYNYNVEKAKELLQEAGVKDGDLSLKLIYNATTEVQAVAEIIQQNLNAVGIKVELEGYDSASITEVSSDSSKWDLYINGGVVNSSIMFHFYNQINQKQADFSFYKNDEFQALIDHGAADLDEDDIQQLIEIFEEDVPEYPLYTSNHYYAVRDGIEGFADRWDNAIYPGDWKYSPETTGWAYED